MNLLNALQRDYTTTSDDSESFCKCSQLSVQLVKGTPEGSFFLEQPARVMLAISVPVYRFNQLQHWLLSVIVSFYTQSKSQALSDTSHLHTTKLYRKGRPYWQTWIDYFRTPAVHSHSFCSPNFALVFKCFWEYAVLPRGYETNSLCKIWREGGTCRPTGKTLADVLKQFATVFHTHNVKQQAKKWLATNGGQLFLIALNVLDYHTFLGNCAPTPPLSQHFARSEK